MSRLKARAEKRRQKSQEKGEEGFWPELCRRIDSGRVIPIVSNSIVNDRIFDIDDDGMIGIAEEGAEEQTDLSIEEQLAEAWAADVGYPLAEPHWLPRVALFDRVVNSPDDRAAKTRYLNWLKDSILFLAEDDPNISEDVIDDLRDEIEAYSFADIVRGLEYPRPTSGRADPLEILAQLKLPVYITTSYHDFLERAIIDNGRQPRTQICFWGEEPISYVDESHRTDHDLVPTPENPIVYHLFGLETYPETLVLSEDDYLDFLTAVSRTGALERPVIPAYIKRALTQSSLILLGFRLRDWDFRVLFRGLISATPSSLRMFNLAIQLDPEQQNHVVSADQARDYLEKYFGSSDFTVEWGSSRKFTERMWEALQAWRQ